MVNVICLLLLGIYSVGAGEEKQEDSMPHVSTARKRAYAELKWQIASACDDVDLEAVKRNKQAEKVRAAVSKIEAVEMEYRDFQLQVKTTDYASRIDALVDKYRDAYSCLWYELSTYIQVVKRERNILLLLAYRVKTNFKDLRELDSDKIWEREINAFREVYKIPSCEAFKRVQSFFELYEKECVAQKIDMGKATQEQTLAIVNKLLQVQLEQIDLVHSS